MCSYLVFILRLYFTFGGLCVSIMTQVVTGQM